MSDSKDSTDLVGLLVKHWKRVVACVVLGAAAAVAYALLATEWYSATLTVVPANTPVPSITTTLAAHLPESLGTGPTDVQRIQAVLSSNSVADEVIEHFNLERHYGTSHREHTRATLRKHCVTGSDRKSELVSLTCEDTDPKLAMEMATFFGEVGNRVFGRISASSAREERRFLEAQVLKARQDVDEASKHLREFQEQHHIVDLPEQSKAVISAIASLQGDLLSKQLELSYLRSFSARNESTVTQLDQQISAIQAKLHQLEASAPPASPASSGSGSNASPVPANKAEFFPGAMDVPKLRFELEQLLREQKLTETVFLMTTERFEAVKIDEARDTSTFQILDQPTLPTFRSRPDRKRIVTLGAIAGACVGLALVLVPAWWRRRALVVT